MIEVSNSVDTVLLDIEGTVCPISFVKETLYPLAIELLPSFLDTHFKDPAYRKEISSSFSSPDDSAEAIIKQVRSLSAQDSKAPYLKRLQGDIWKEAYEQGKVTTPLFEDVLPAFKKWQDQGKELAIFSSGSVKAQKMFFGHVMEIGKIEDVNSQFIANFDTINAGPKMVMESYVKIAKEMGKDEKGILFLSDNVKEIEAAIEAGMRAIVVDRPGNAPLSEEERKKFDVVESLSELVLV